MTPAQRRAAVVALAAAIAVPAEGLRQTAYRDPPGIWTICFGTTLGVKQGDRRTIEECRAFLMRDMLESVATVERCSKVTLGINQTAAFADAVYNLGPKVVCDTKRSTLARKLQAGDVTGACNELPRWDKANMGGVMVALPGLTKRRAVERETCLKPDAAGVA